MFGVKSHFIYFPPHIFTDRKLYLVIMPIANSTSAQKICIKFSEAHSSIFIETSREDLVIILLSNHFVPKFEVLPQQDSVQTGVPMLYEQ